MSIMRSQLIKCMCFRASKYKNFEFPKFKLHDGVIDYVNSYKYLGHIVSNINDKEDMDRQINFIYARGSTLIRNFDKCSQLVKVILFRSFICNVYCSHLWYNYTQRSLSSVVTAYNNIFRRFFHLPRYADGTVYSATAMLHDLELPTAREIIATNATSLYRRIRTSTNTILVAFVDSDLFDRSVIRRSWVSNEYCTQLACIGIILCNYLVIMYFNCHCIYLCNCTPMGPEPFSNK